MHSYKMNISQEQELFTSGEFETCQECEMLFLALPGQITCTDCVEAKGRDLTYHKRFFALLGTIYQLMPKSFQKQVKKGDFYKYLKKGKEETRSAKFTDMDQEGFQEYIRDFLNFIYVNLIAYYWPVDDVERIKAEIEKKYKTLIEPNEK